MSCEQVLLPGRHFRSISSAVLVQMNGCGVLVPLVNPLADVGPSSSVTLRWAEAAESLQVGELGEPALNYGALGEICLYVCLSDSLVIG